jgi:hypothetical protein
MSDPVTIKTFSDPTEASLAKNDLIAAGIKAVLIGEETNALWRVPTEVGMIRLQVAAKDAAQAANILKEPARFVSEEELADEAESTIDPEEED